MSSYSLEALVGARDVMAALPEPLAAMGAVPLAGDLVLVPVPLSLLGHLYGDEPVLTAAREVLEPLVAAASAAGPIAYLHAELFNDEGSQGALVWQRGAVVFEAFQDPATDVGPIDRGLAVLGVTGETDLDDPDEVADGRRDAFAQLGLGRHRTLDAWIADAAAART